VKTNKPFIIPIFLPQAGCPHRCVFCNQYAITNIRTHQISNEALSENIDRFLSYNHRNNPHVQISFYGGNFLGLPESEMLKLLECAQGYVNNKKVTGIRFSTRPDTVNQKQLQLLTKYAIQTVELGVQSMDDIVLYKSQRGHTSENTIQATHILKNYGYQVGHQLMSGLPDDNPKSFMQTIERVIDLKPDFVRLYPTLVLKGSLLAKWFYEGLYNPLSLNDAVSMAKKCLERFQNNHIPVIRMGIQPQDRLEDYIIAGPYHPAFGHLVYSELMLDNVKKRVQQSSADDIFILVHPRKVSQMKGIHQKNVKELTRRFPDKTIQIISDPGISDLQILEMKHKGGSCEK
jgi:histone acetyltransferase (RNA polymerase elongator complex component)